MFRPASPWAVHRFVHMDITKYRRTTALLMAITVQSGSLAVYLSERDRGIAGRPISTAMSITRWTSAKAIEVRCLLVESGPPNNARRFAAKPCTIRVGVRLRSADKRPPQRLLWAWFQPLVPISLRQAALRQEFDESIGGRLRFGL